MPHVPDRGARAGTGSVLDRPLVGWSLMAIAAVHTVAAPAVYPDSLRSTWHAGVLNAVERDASLIALRGVGFWYVTTGFAMALLGAIVRWGELRVGRVPRWFGVGLLAFGAWGAALMPKSGFWAFTVPALLALRRPRGSSQHAARVRCCAAWPACVVLPLGSRRPGAERVASPQSPTRPAVDAG
jgi:uncharacterized protein DUF6463